MKVILIGHGETGIAFKKAVEIIFGKAADLIPLTFEPGEGLKDVESKVKKAILGYNSKNILVLTDLFSGTPYNATAKLALEGKVADVVAGMCLPMLLDVVTNMNQLNVPDLVKKIIEDSSMYTHVLSKEVSKADEEDDF